MRPLTTEHIMAATVARTRVLREDMAKRWRERDLVTARWAFVYVCRTANSYPIAYADITRTLRGDDRCHSGTIHAFKRASERASEDFDFWSLCDDIAAMARRLVSPERRTA